MAKAQESAGLTKTGKKVTIDLHRDEYEVLRLRAFRDRRSQASILRAALRQYLEIED